MVRQVILSALLALAAAANSTESVQNDAIQFLRAAAAKHSLIYLIRHGEKPDDDDNKYLSPRGEQRAACLAKKWKNFGFKSLYCPDFDRDTNEHGRACQTLRPLPQATGIPLTSSYDVDDDSGVAKAIVKAVAKGAVLLAWEHKVLSDIVNDLNGASKDYPGDEFDLIWTYDADKGKFLADSYENC
ncbi:hypothetical protein AC1031_010265 [Aphanomyces cochlioides]|nr:hypothetical protein AC1031_010265 [Aphanomyces cochlioides]